MQNLDGVDIIAHLSMKFYNFQWCLTLSNIYVFPSSSRVWILFYQDMSQHCASLRERQGHVPRRYAMFVLEKMWDFMEQWKINHTHMILLFGALSSKLVSLASVYFPKLIICPFYIAQNAQNFWQNPKWHPASKKVEVVCMFYHMIILVFESTACHLQIACKGSLSHNQLAFTALSYFLLFRVCCRPVSCQNWRRWWARVGRKRNQKGKQWLALVERP